MTTSMRTAMTTITQEEHHHHHEHRGLPEILAIIRSGGLTPGARALAERIFQILAEAEAKAHGVPLDQVHFHEVGAVDSIVDIVSAAVCLDNLAPDEVIVTGLSEGSGFVRCQHGMIPVPVPAVLNIVQAHGLTLVPTGIQGELVTPTGAAIVAAIRTKETLPSSFKCTRTGLGAGKRTYERPSLLRAMMLETEENDEKDTIWKLECNIDDCTGEALGYCMGKLLRSGARDVHYIPVYMKKNRPAYQLDVICEDSNAGDVGKYYIRRDNHDRHPPLPDGAHRDETRVCDNRDRVRRCGSQDLPPWRDRKNLPRVRECRTNCRKKRYAGR